MLGNNSFFDYGFSIKRITALLVGWCLIITVCGFLVKSKSKSKRRSY